MKEFTVQEAITAIAKLTTELNANKARVARLETALREIERMSELTSWVVPICRAALSGARTADELAVGCHRSHPHENMDAGCQRLTEIARENNAAANMGTEARCWHCGMVTLKAHYDDCPASGARTATDTGGKPDA